MTGRGRRSIPAAPTRRGKSRGFAASFRWQASIGSRFLSAKALWEVNAEGAVKLTLDAEKDSIFPWMPRFGLTLTLPREYRSVSYLGYGPDESYQDKHRASWIDRFETSVDSLHEDYVRPQENGSHFHCYDVQVGPSGRRAACRFPSTLLTIRNRS